MADALASMLDQYREKRELDQATLEGMVFYAQTGLCRWQVLLSHLEGETSAQRCGTCDNCRRIAIYTAQAQVAVTADPVDPHHGLGTEVGRHLGFPGHDTASAT